MTITFHMNDGKLTGVTYETPQNLVIPEETAQLAADERILIAMRLWHPDSHDGYSLDELAERWCTTRENLLKLQDGALLKLAATPHTETSTLGRSDQGKLL